MALTAGWCLFFAGLPWAAFLFQPKLDIWHAQAAWAQGGVLLGLMALVGYPRAVKVPENWPLACFLGWAGFKLWWTWQGALKAGVKIYPTELLMPGLHLLFLALFYQVAVSTWTRERLAKIFRTMAYAGIVVMVYSVSQVLGWDQFYRELGTKGHNRALVGTIGNPSHYQLYLALLLPVLLTLPKRTRLLSLGLWTLLLARLVVVDHSLAGVVAVPVVLAWWAWHQPHRGWWLAGLGGLLLVGGYWLAQQADSLWSFNGRSGAWAAFGQLFQATKPITGLGNGAVMGLSERFTGPIYTWRHAHNEFFQVAMEQGMVGLMFLLWMVWAWSQRLFRLPNDMVKVTLGGVGMASLIGALAHFNWHLWLLGSFALVAYGGVYALEGSA